VEDWESGRKKKKERRDKVPASETRMPNLHRATITQQRVRTMGGDRGGLAQWEKLGKGNKEEEEEEEEEKKRAKLEKGRLKLTGFVHGLKAHESIP
jgi:hypothetical protein